MTTPTATSSAPGSSRCPGPSTRDIIAADRGGAPAHILEETYTFLGDSDLPFDRYTSTDFLDRELRDVWEKTWQWACREEDIPDTGDYITYEIGDRSVLIVRCEDGLIKAYPNACLHRGTQLKPAGSCGHSRQLRCPFHGFTWSLQGSLQEIPCRWDFPHVEDDRFSLPELRVGQWGGFVFINFDSAAQPLEEFLGVLTEHFASWDLENRFVALHIRKKLPANWKACIEAFLESYHVLETHPQGVATVGDANTQYDILDHNVSRFVHLVGFPSPHLSREQSEQETLDALMGEGVVEGVGSGESPLQVAHGSTARETFANHLKMTLGEAYDRDFSALTVTETIDAIEYSLFPNTCLFPSLLFPMVYRFRPDGRDPDNTVFDLLYLQPLPASGERPDPAEPIDLSVEQSFHEVPGLDPGLATIYDQDTGNLIAQQRGFKASTKAGATLANYQEARIRHLHQRIDAYLNEGRNQ